MPPQSYICEHSDRQTISEPIFGVRLYPSLVSFLHLLGEQSFRYQLRNLAQPQREMLGTPARVRLPRCFRYWELRVQSHSKRSQRIDSHLGCFPALSWELGSLESSFWGSQARIEMINSVLQTKNHWVSQGQHLNHGVYSWLSSQWLGKRFWWRHEFCFVH